MEPQRVGIDGEEGCWPDAKFEAPSAKSNRSISSREESREKRQERRQKTEESSEQRGEGRQKREVWFL